MKASAPGPSDGWVETAICETAPALTEKLVLTAASQAGAGGGEGVTTSDGVDLQITECGQAVDGIDGGGADQCRPGGAGARGNGEGDWICG